MFLFKKMLFFKNIIINKFLESEHLSFRFFSIVCCRPHSYVVFRLRSKILHRMRQFSRLEFVFGTSTRARANKLEFVDFSFRRVPFYRCFVGKNSRCLDILKNRMWQFFDKLEFAARAKLLKIRGSRVMLADYDTSKVPVEAGFPS